MKSLDEWRQSAVDEAPKIETGIFALRVPLHIWHTKQRTVKNVHTAIKQTGKLLAKAGCARFLVKAVCRPSAAKGGEA